MEESLFNSLMTSLSEVKDHREGKITLRSKTISISPKGLERYIGFGPIFEIQSYCPS